MPLLSSDLFKVLFKQLIQHIELGGLDDTGGDLYRVGLPGR